MSVAAILVAGGRGTRMGSDRPKQYLHVGGKPILRRTLETYLDHHQIDLVQVVIGDADRMDYDAAISGLHNEKLREPVVGRANRSGSVRAGLDALAQYAPDKVLIHDAARPFCPDWVISAVVSALEEEDGAFAALPVVDALWRADGTHADDPVPRDGLVRAQTPQGFGYAKIVKAYEAFDGEAADDVAVARAAGLAVRIVPSDEENFKVTTPSDLARANRFLAGADYDTA